jgi:hypothetical protein
MTKPVDFDALNRAFDEEMDADYGNITDDEVRDILNNMGTETPEAYRKIGAENFFDL